MYFLNISLFGWWGGGVYKRTKDTHRDVLIMRHDLRHIQTSSQDVFYSIPEEDGVGVREWDRVGSTWTPHGPLTLSVKDTLPGCSLCLEHSSPLLT